LHHEFWMELLEEKPVTRKLQNLGSKITTDLEKSVLKFRDITDTHPNHIKTLTIYGHFLTSV
jgi:hypothetical protein